MQTLTLPTEEITSVLHRIIGSLIVCQTTAIYAESVDEVTTARFPSSRAQKKACFNSNPIALSVDRIHSCLRCQVGPFVDQPVCLYTTNARQKHPATSKLATGD